MNGLVWTRCKEDETQLTAKGDNVAYTIHIDNDGFFVCYCSNGDALHADNDIWTEDKAMRIANQHYENLLNVQGDKK